MKIGKTKVNDELDLSKLPQHIAIIMDGNGRWAKKRGLPRKFGHKAGCDNIKKITRNIFDLGIKIVTYFAFSTENWKRPKEEIDEIFNLIRKYVEENTEDFVSDGIKVTFCGKYEELPKDIVDSFKKVQNETKYCSKNVLNFAVNYGGRDEIIRAVNKAIKIGEPVTEQSFAKLLDNGNLVDPDFVIRTSGELRISNFMLYEMAYSEFYFCKTYWPSFGNKELQEALISYQNRNRRFGSIK
ncbi:MAG: di-trans,poly-cis-decaprenylcistransferase [Clostridia bacterium]|nr:di-trans,poly-cis-decaprenylcistransferase [Clostridia bacterium]